MTIDNRTDAILVKYITYKDDKEEMLGAYYTHAINETLKAFITMKECNIECLLHLNEESLDTESFWIEDIYVSLASTTTDHVPAIEVILK